MEVKLSIIVPVYNVRAHLDKCIESILGQSFEDFELILVDDGSTDGSGAVCDSYINLDSRVKVIHKKNEGVVSARKAGIKAAVGKYAGYVDGDDWIEKDMYKNMVHYMDKYDCDIVMCDVVHESRALPLSSGSTDNNIDEGYYSREKLENDIFPTMLYTGKFYTFGIYPVIWNKLYRREKLIKHQDKVLNDIKTGEDAACVYPYLYDSDSMYFIKDMYLYHYRPTEESMTAKYDNRYFDRFTALYKFFSNTALARSAYAGQLKYYYAYGVKTSISNELKPENRRSLSRKIRTIRDICEFAVKEGFLQGLNITPFYHGFYFGLIKNKMAFPLVLSIYTAKFIQRLFGRK